MFCFMGMLISNFFKFFNLSMNLVLRCILVGNYGMIKVI